MAYRLEATPTFDRAFGRLDPSTARQVAEKLKWLSAHPDMLRQPVRYLPGELHGLQKYRIGDWRVLFWVDHAKQTITLYTVEHRSKIYKQLK